MVKKLIIPLIFLLLLLIVFSLLFISQQDSTPKRVKPFWLPFVKSPGGKEESIIRLKQHPVIQKWSSMSFVSIDDSEEFREMIDDADLRLDAAVTEEQEKELKEALWNFLLAFRDGDFDRYRGK